MKLIKYKNRKLYDSTSSRYVTHVELLQEAVAGREVSVFCNTTKNDITVPILLAALGTAGNWSVPKDKLISFLKEASPSNGQVLSQ